jgi:glutamine---fructose-6-phosphate transaminase (isomerizing)
MITFMDEIREQPEALRRFAQSIGRETIEADALLGRKWSRIVFAGMGSSLYASYVPVLALRQRGINAMAFEANELTAFRDAALDPNTLLVAVSQSGGSKEVVALCSSMPSQDNVLIVTNNLDRPLAAYGAARLMLQAGYEHRTSTKSYTNTLAALLHIADRLAGIPGMAGSLAENLMACAAEMERILSEPEDTWRRVLPMLDRAFVVTAGSGASYTSASHCELVLEEAARVFASRYTTGQFIHGPIELINEKMGVLVFDSDEWFCGKAARVLENMQAYGGGAFVVSPFEHREEDGLVAYRIKVPGPFFAPLLEVLPVELVADMLGKQRGNKPGFLERVAK